MRRTTPRTTRRSTPGAASPRGPSRKAQARGIRSAPGPPRFDQVRIRAPGPRCACASFLAAKVGLAQLCNSTCTCSLTLGPALHRVSTAYRTGAAHPQDRLPTFHYASHCWAGLIRPSREGRRHAEETRASDWLSAPKRSHRGHLRQAGWSAPLDRSISRVRACEESARRARGASGERSLSRKGQ